MATNQGSRVYELSIDGTQFTLTSLLDVPTIEAKDVAFIQVDDSLFLVFAHRGNRMPHDVTEVESTLLKFDLLEDNFEIIQGYKGLDSNDEVRRTNGDFTTRNPHRLLQFRVHTRQYLIFANLDRDTFSIDEPEEGHSYVYTYDYSTRRMKLVQKLVTFAAVDATVFKIEDPYNPLNSQWFLIFAVNRGGDDKKMDSLVFKWINGRFLPYQSIPVPGSGKAISVGSHTNLYKTQAGDDVLEHYIAFLTDMAYGNLYLYQYNGYSFELVDQSALDSSSGCPLTFNVNAPEDFPDENWWIDPSGDYSVIGTHNSKPLYSISANNGLRLFYNVDRARWMIDLVASMANDYGSGMIRRLGDTACPPTEGWVYMDYRETKPNVAVREGFSVPKLSNGKVPSKLREQSLSQNLAVVFENGNVRALGVSQYHSTAFNKFNDVSKNVRSFISDAKNALPESEIASLKEEFIVMPKTTDANIELDDVTFQGSVSATNFKVNKEFCLKDVEGQCTNQPSIEVSGKTTIDAGMVDDFNQYIDGSYPDNVDTLDASLTSLKTEIAEKGVNIESSVTMTNDVVFKKLNAVKVTASELRLQSPANSDAICPVIQKTSTSTAYDFVDFIKHAIPSPAQGTTLTLQQGLTFENLKIEGEYNIETLNGESVGNYWQSFKDKTVEGMTTFEAAPTFSKNAEVDGTVGGKTFSTSKILLHNGDQTLTDAYDIQTEVEIVKLQTDSLNGFDLASLNSLANYGDSELSFSMVSVLEVDTLELPKLTMDLLDVEVEGAVTKVHMKDLVDYSMKKSTANTVSLKYNFQGNVSATSVQSTVINTDVFEDTFKPLTEGDTLAGNYVFSELDVASLTVNIGDTINSLSSDSAIASHPHSLLLTGNCL